MVKNKRTAIAICFLIAFGAKAQTSYTLEQCVQYGLTNHLSIKNAELEQQKAALTVKETKTIGMPQIDGKLDFMTNLAIQNQFVSQEAFLTPTQISEAKQKFKDAGLEYDLDKKTTGLAFGVPFSSGGSVTVSQLLFSGSYLVGLQAAKTYQTLSAKLEERTEQEVVANVTKAYYGSIVNKNRVNMLQALVKQLEKIESDMDAYVKVGMQESIEKDKITVTLNNTRTELEKINNLQAVLDNVLKYQMGLSLAEQITLLDDLNFFITKENASAVPVFSQEKNIDIQLIKIQKELALLKVKNIKMSRLPTAAAFGNFGANYGAIQFNELYKFNNWKPYGMVGAQINVPIFHSFADKHKLNQELIGVNLLDNNLIMANNGLELAYKTNVNVYENNKLALSRQKANAELAQRVFDNINIKYKNGLGSSFDLVNAETQLKTAQTDYISVVYDLLVSKIDLDKSAGTLVVPTTTK